MTADGNARAVSAGGESSGTGAAYVFVRGNDVWSQQAHIKASNADAGDGFGGSVALSADGDLLAVGASGEASAASGVGGDQADDSLVGAGAVYVFARGGDAWSQRAYVKASNPDAEDGFGGVLALSVDGSTLAISPYKEDSAATGIGGDQQDNSLQLAGAVYLF